MSQLRESAASKAAHSSIRIDREAKEKSYLSHRAAAHLDPITKNNNNIDIIQQPFKIEPSSSLYLPDQQRLNKQFDAVTFSQQQRQQEQHRKQTQIELRRNENQQREQRRQQFMQEQKEQQQKYVDNLVKREANKPNKQSIPYNIINHRYEDSQDGSRLEYHDAVTKFKAKQRSAFLEEKRNSPFDPITGQERKTTVVPPRPNVPDSLKNLPKY